MGSGAEWAQATVEAGGQAMTSIVGLGLGNNAIGAAIVNNTQRELKLLIGSGLLDDGEVISAPDHTISPLGDKSGNFTIWAIAKKGNSAQGCEGIIW